MKSRYQRCYQAASGLAAGLVITSVLFAVNRTVVHGFTLLAQPSSTGTCTTTQVTCTWGDCTGEFYPVAYRNPGATRRQSLMRNTRQMRTVIRMAFDGSSTPSERELKQEAERVDKLRKEAEKSRKRGQVSHELRVAAETIRLQAEEALSEDTKRTPKPHDAEQVLEYKRGKLAEKILRQDVLIEKLHEAHSRDSQQTLRALVRQEIGEIDAELFMRIVDLEGGNGQQEDSSVFIHDVMQAIDIVDKEQALKVSMDKMLYWNEFYESCSYDEAETNRFAVWLGEYQQERAAHQKARSAHPDPTKLDSDFFRVFRDINKYRRDETTDAALKAATNLLLVGARATTCYGSMECVAGKYRQVGPLRYPDYVEGACCTGPVRYPVDVPEGNAHVATYELGSAGEHPLGRFFGRFQDSDNWGTNLGGVVSLVEAYTCSTSSGPSPELEAFLEALVASGSVALLTNTRMDGGGGRVLRQLLASTIHRRASHLTCVETHRLGLRLLARTTFLSAEQAAAMGCTHPFMALIRARPQSNAEYFIEEIEYYGRGYGSQVNDAALQVVYLAIFMYRRYPWPQRQRYRADATIAKWVEEDLDRSAFEYNRMGLVRNTLKWAISLPGFFQALLEHHSVWLLLAAYDIEERHFAPGKKRRSLFLNASFSSRRQETLLIQELKNNRLLTAWMCSKAGRHILLEICRQRRRRVVQAVATVAPSAFAPAVPEVLAFMRGPSVRGKKERLVEWLESKLEYEGQDMQRW